MALVMALTLAIAGCGIGAPHGPVVTPPSETTSPAPTVSGAVAQTRLQVAGALAAAGFQLLVPTQPFRPPESGLLAAAPRAVFQVALADEPMHGYIVVYEFPDVAQTTIAGRQMAGYLGSGNGRVQFPQDSRHILRQIGTTLVFYSWSPANSPGPATTTIGQVLATIGQGFDIPR